MTTRFSISMPDPIAAELDGTSRHLRMDRSEYVTRAVKEALRRDSVQLRQLEAQRALDTLAGQEDGSLQAFADDICQGLPP